MKAKMKKISLLVFYKEREEITEKLQDLGVIHLETEIQEDEQLTHLLKERDKYQEALDILATVTDVPSVESEDKPQLKGNIRLYSVIISSA